MGPKRKDAQHLELDDADILAVVDPSDDNTIPRARRPERLTLNSRPRAAGKRSCHSRTWRQASSITHLPSGTISPVSSARRMNSSGESTPRSGWCHRSNASTA